MAWPDRLARQLITSSLAENMSVDAKGMHEMFKIAVCDGNYEVVNALEQFIMHCNHHQEFEVFKFASGAELLCSLKSNHRFNLIILEAPLGKTNTFEMGQWHCPELGSAETQVLFLSSTVASAMPFPDSQPSGSLCNSVWFNFSVGHEQHQVPYKDLLYFESRNRKIYIACRDEEHSFYGKLSELSEGLPPMFLRVHQSYLVNCNRIVETDYRQIVMSNGHRIPVSRTYQKSLRQFRGAVAAQQSPK